MSYRNDLDALTARHEALDAELAVKIREQDAVREALDAAKARAQLPVLDNLRVASPCKADWKQMQGDERVRACGSCNKNVFNLSNMTRDEAEALLVAHTGELCVRYYQRSDGTILLADCTIGVRQRRGRRIVAAALAVGVVAGYALHQESQFVTMGSVGSAQSDEEIAAERAFLAQEQEMLRIVKP